MLNSNPQTHVLRNRKIHSSPDSPHEPLDLVKSQTPIPSGPIASLPPDLLKSLPLVPKTRCDNRSRITEAIYKPLPPPPRNALVRNTLYWITGFCLCFLLIVVLLPVITEKDAMPGFNQWLQNLL